MKTPEVNSGDYVLATKWHDGDTGDQWAVGFYREAYDHFGSKRHVVVDENNVPFRANGFRRVKKISIERGAWLVRNKKMFEGSSFSMWHFARCKMF